jgi:hypothetical protein
VRSHTDNVTGGALGAGADHGADATPSVTYSGPRHPPRRLSGRSAAFRAPVLSMVDGPEHLT